MSMLMPKLRGKVSAGLLAAAALGVALGACRQTAGPSPAGVGEACRPEMRDFSRRLLLTAEVSTRDAVQITAPGVPIWPLTVRYMVEDGTLLAAGDKVAEFDPSQLLSQIENLETQVKTASGDLSATFSRAAAELADLELERAQKGAARDRAVVESRLPAELVPARELAEKALALERAELELANAEAKAKGTREAQRAAIAVREIELERVRAELAALRDHLGRMVVAAPAAGVFVAADNPREQRQVQAGDALWSGFPLGRIPSAAGWQVEARLSDVDDGKIAVGQEVRAFLDSAPGRELHGRIARIDQIAQEISRSSPRRAFQVIVELEEFGLGHPQTLAQELRPGMSLRVEAVEPPRRVQVLPRRCLAIWPADQVLACSAQECEVAGP